MKRLNFFKTFLLILLIAALAFSSISCALSGTDQGKSSSVSSGESKTFTFEVYLKGESTPKSTYTITSDKATVGEALVDKGLIEGENGRYGLYVKVVDGVRADSGESGYWMFYSGNSLSPVGVDSMKIENGATYSFRIE